MEMFCENLPPEKRARASDLVKFLMAPPSRMAAGSRGTAPLLSKPTSSPTLFPAFFASRRPYLGNLQHKLSRASKIHSAA